MPESYQVMEARLKRTIPPKDDGKGGQWPEKHVYALQLDPLNGGQPIEAEELRFHKAPAPKEGEHVEGEITSGNFGLTFKRARKDEPSLVSAPKASDGRDSYRKHPAEVAGARRSAAQEKAVYWAAVLQRAQPDIKPSYEWLEGIIDWFDEDARKASEKA